MTPHKTAMYHKIFNEIFDSCRVIPDRCLTDRQLHERMAKVCKLSLDDLQRKVDLSKIKVAGPGVEFITVPK